MVFQRRISKTRSQRGKEKDVGKFFAASLKPNKIFDRPAYLCSEASTQICIRHHSPFHLCFCRLFVASKSLKLTSSIQLSFFAIQVLILFYSSQFGTKSLNVHIIFNFSQIFRLYNPAPQYVNMYENVIKRLNTYMI